MPGKSKSVDIGMEGGLYARGKIIGRKRSTFGDPPVQKVGYHVWSPDGTLVIDRFGEHDYMKVGDELDERVLIRAFKRKNGAVGISVMFADGNVGQGEDF